MTERLLRVGPVAGCLCALALGCGPEPKVISPTDTKKAPPVVQAGGGGGKAPAKPGPPHKGAD